MRQVMVLSGSSKAIEEALHLAARKDRDLVAVIAPEPNPGTRQTLEEAVTVLCTALKRELETRRQLRLDAKRADEAA